MFDRPSSHIWQVFNESFMQPKKHDDVVLDDGECVGIVIGDRRYVVSVDEDGKAKIKTQKKVESWVDEQD